MRARFRALGIEYGFVYTGEVLDNASGGLRQGAIVDGKLETILKADLGKIAGWDGLTFYTNSFQLHGTGRLKRDYVGGIVTISNIEALPTIRLSELWLEQKLAGGAASIRAGQLAADTEFFFSNYAAFFVNSDWPTIGSANLPSGGPAYPLSTPGVRLKVEPAKDTTFLFALFNGDPAGPGPPGDIEKRNRFGVNFRVNDPPLIVSELQWTRNQDKSAPGPATSLKLGGWVHVGHFDDQRFGADGLSLADPLSNAIALQHWGNRGIYGIVDQQLYRPAGGDANSGLLAFMRISASPSDRNLVDFYVEAGFLASGLIPGRPDDKFGVEYILARISDSARALDVDVARFGGPLAVRDAEATLEISYQAQLRQGWILQPLFQYVWHPSGSPAIPDATVLGLRTVVTY